MICQKILGQKWHKFWRNFFQQTLISMMIIVTALVSILCWAFLILIKG
ncbi:hypothetical protein CWATWH0401_1227 [Crocosphaera watsonii WH 0401]|uniref:Uncharacterized protein n=1 Tax=Crocosphaera watsonii WH 0401 TaxID=555881 RepID=T2J8A8_CROWT|nr:hypothetical protein CWATWH0401_1227 [Crocosphaera watsonii WH 0401]